MPMAYLLPWVALDLREFEFSIVGIHLLDLIPRWCAQYFDDFNQLIYARVAWENRLSKQELG
jgi:hypothetical protein